MAGDGVLIIGGAKRIGHGKRRDVFLHPEDPAKVVKVYRPDRTPARMRALRWYWRFLPLSRFDDHLKDLRQYRRVARRAPDFLHAVAPVYGLVETDRGRALVAQRVGNADGSRCESLRDFVAAGGLDRITPVLEDFFESLARHHITVEDPNAHNILVRRQGEDLDLVLVDGLGDPTVIPYKSVFKGVNRRKLMSKKVKLFRKLRVIADGAR